MNLNLGYLAAPGVLELGYAGAYVTAPATLTEGETATITITGNTAEPAEARLNGTVVALTAATGDDYTFPVPLLPDDTNAEIQVDVDGYTSSAATNYSNLIPYANTQHGNPHEQSVLYQANLATLQPYEIRIASDTDPAVMTVDWDQIDADGAWLDSIEPYITMASGVESGSSSATVEFYRHEQGDIVSRVATIEDLGPNGTVTIDDITESRTGATISFSYDKTDADGFKYSIDQGATWTITSSPTELDGLQSGTAHDYWVAAYNVDALGIITKTTFTTLEAIDTAPDAFTFIDATGVALSTTENPNKVVSNAITVKGVDAGTDVPISVSGDTGSKYRVSTDGGLTFGAWTATATNVRLNYQAQVQHDASTDYSSGGHDGVRETTLTVGGVTGTFTSTTIADTTKPVISLTGGNQTIVQGGTWAEPGYTATDNADGDITTDVVVTGTVDTSTLGQYPLTYTVEDASGNTASTTRTVTVVEATVDDQTDPVISLTGGNRTLTVGDAWVEPGYTATDDVDGDLTAQVVVTGTVDTSAPGTTTLTYTVSDAAGNSASVTRTVTVVPATQYPLTALAPTNRTFEAKRLLRFEAAEPLFILQSGETLDFDFDLTDWLTDQGDDINGGGHNIGELAESLDVMASGRVTGTSRVKVWLQASEVKDSESSLVQLTVTTSGFRTAVFQFRALIINRMQ